MFETEPRVFPRRAQRVTLVTLADYVDDLDLPGLRGRGDRGLQRRAVVVGLDLADGFESDDAGGHVVEHLEHRAPPRASRSRRYRRTAWSCVARSVTSPLRRGVEQSGSSSGS